MSESNMAPAEVLAVLDDVWSRGLLMANVHKFERARTAVAALIAERDALRKDAERLDWLDANNIPKSIGWKVGVAPLGNAAVSSVVFLGSKPVTIRQAIDAARAEVGRG